MLFAKSLIISYLSSIWVIVESLYENHLKQASVSTTLVTFLGLQYVIKIIKYLWSAITLPCLIERYTKNVLNYLFLPYFTQLLKIHNLTEKAYNA